MTSGLKKYFFITGMIRSGTTLLDKMLSKILYGNVFSQPLPFVYRYFKAEFLQEINVIDPYVLGNLFANDRYSKHDFFDFLERKKIDLTELSEILKMMLSWDGQYTRVSPSVLRSFGVKSLSLNDCYTSILEELSLGNRGILGSKEVLCEEFIPYFLNKQIKVLCIVRDPRDVITSIYCGRGPDFVGKTRPTLFHLRNWRKSVMISLSYINDPNFKLLRYEDLVSAPNEKIHDILDFLDVDLPVGSKSSGIDFNKMEIWGGNSSISNLEENGILKNNYGKFPKYLSENMVKYIEKTCFSEMRYLGYDIVHKEYFDFEDFHEPKPVEVEDLEKDYSICKENIDLENERIQFLTGGRRIEDDKIEKYFYSTTAFNILKKGE